MGFFESIGKFFTRVIEGIFTFLVSPAAPFVLAVLLAVAAFFILRSVYRRMRDRRLPNLTFERKFADPGVYAGEMTELHETLTNRRFFPMFGVTVEAYLFNELRISGFEPPKKDGMQYMTERFSLWPYMRIRRRHRIECRKRGFYALQSASSPTRIGEYWFESPASIHVFPRPVPVSAVIEAAGRMQGDERSARHLFSDPFSIAGVRDYRFGDSVSSINFKASARTWFAGTSSVPLKVNARDFCADRRLLVFMDFHLERDSGIDGIVYSRRLEVGLSYASALIREAIYGGFSAGFFCNCRQSDGAMALRFPPAGGQEHMLSIFRAMAELFFEDGASYPMLLSEAIEEGTRDCEIVSISLCPSGRTDELLATLSRMGNSVRNIILNSSDEEWAD